MNLRSVLKQLPQVALDNKVKAERLSATGASWIITLNIPENKLLIEEGTKVLEVQYYRDEAGQIHRVSKSAKRCQMSICQIAIRTFDSLDTMLLDSSEVFSNDDPDYVLPDTEKQEEKVEQEPEQEPETEEEVKEFFDEGTLVVKSEPKNSKKKASNKKGD